jgi:hypothetical protein
LTDRLENWAKNVREKVYQLPPGPERAVLLHKISQANAAAHLEESANSSELQPPK